MAGQTSAITIGSYNVLVVARRSEFGLFLSAAGEEVLLPNRYVPADAKEGDRLRVFVYTDSEDRPVATLQEPKAVVGDFAFLQVVDVNRFGAFLDWGLEKDLFVPFAEQAKPMEKGKSYVVRLCLDERSRRVIGVSRLSRFLSRCPRGLVPGKKVNLLVFDASPLGYSVIIDGAYRGLLHHDNTAGSLTVGTRCEGYIQRIRPDLLVDVSLRRQGLEAVVEARPRILELLEKEGGFLPLGDKADARLIERTFGLSKKSFKKVIGNLYRDRLIEILPDGIRLVTK